jgi:5-(carboxyamino)imidazole ribonucleotide synthase
VTETVHEAEILRRTVSPPRATATVCEQARSVALDVLDVMEGRGVYGIELFETSDGEILLNEIAPRPHNSGHWTIEGCHTSQFEQHLRAVTGRPLGTTERRCPTVSANILSDVVERQEARLDGVEAVLEQERCALHWYGKHEAYDLRKMGHVTLPGQRDTESLLDTLDETIDSLTFEQ